MAFGLRCRNKPGRSRGLYQRHMHVGAVVEWWSYGVRMGVTIVGGVYGDAVVWCSCLVCLVIVYDSGIVVLWNCGAVSRLCLLMVLLFYGIVESIALVRLRSCEVG